MTKAEKLVEDFVEKVDNPFTVMNTDCPSSYKMEDSYDCCLERGELDFTVCFRCWMEEVEE